MSTPITAGSIYLEDRLGGLRKQKNYTSWSLADNSTSEVIVNTEGEIIGQRTANGGMTLSGTVVLKNRDPTEARYMKLRASREQVTIIFDLQGGHRWQFLGQLAKFEPKVDNQGNGEANVEWSLGEPQELKDGNEVL